MKAAYGKYSDFTEETARLLRKNDLDKDKVKDKIFYNFTLPIQRDAGIQNLLEEETIDSTKRKLSGYAAIFNSESVDLGGYTEVLLPGCFKTALLKNPDVRCLFNHDEDMVLGRTSSGTLRLWEDKKGLFFEVDLPDTAHGRDVYTSVQRGDLSQCSFGFILTEGGCYYQNNVRYIETIYELFDVSVVTFPAYTDTSVNISRKIFEEKQEARKLRKKKTQVTRVTMALNREQTALNYDEIETVKQVYEISQKRKLTNFQLALIGTKFNTAQFLSEEGVTRKETHDFIKFKKDMHYIIFSFSVKEGDCDKNDIRSITELYFWHHKSIVSDFEVGGLAKKIEGVDTFIADPAYYSKEFCEFCLEIFMRANGFGKCYQQNKLMQARVRELKKQGIESAAPWELNSKEWKMTKAGYKHIQEL